MTSSSVKNALCTVLEISDEMIMRSIWHRYTEWCLNAQFYCLSKEKENSANHRQIVYAGDNVNSSGTRFYGIEYDLEEVVRKGILLFIIHGSALGARCTAYIINRLCPVSVQHDNEKVAIIYRNLRFSCTFRTRPIADVNIDVVSLRKNLRVVVFLRDI